MVITLETICEQTRMFPDIPDTHSQPRKSRIIDNIRQTNKKIKFKPFVEFQRKLPRNIPARCHKLENIETTA